MVAEIVGVHGVKGHVKIRHFLADPAKLTDFKTLQTQDGDSFKLKILFFKGTSVVAHIPDVDTRSQAQILKHKKLFIDSDELPVLDETTFYIADLIGLPVYGKDSQKKIGAVVDVQDFGAGSFLEIQPEITEGSKDTFFLPFNESAVPTVDLDKGIAYVDELFAMNFIQKKS